MTRLLRALHEQAAQNLRHRRDQKSLTPPIYSGNVKGNRIHQGEVPGDGAYLRKEREESVSKRHGWTESISERVEGTVPTRTSREHIHHSIQGTEWTHEREERSVCTQDRNKASRDGREILEERRLSTPEEGG